MVPGIDVHLSADTHERTYQLIDVNGTWVVEPGAFGSFLGRLDLVVKDGRVTERKWQLIELTAAHFGEDPKVKASVCKALAPMAADLDRPIGHAVTTLARYDVLETNSEPTREGRVVGDRPAVSAAFARFPTRSDAMIADAEPSDLRSYLTAEGARLSCSNKRAKRFRGVLVRSAECGELPVVQSTTQENS